MAGIEERLRPLLSGGRKIEAIGVYRRETGAGLEEAVAAVEALERGEELPERAAAPPPDPELEREVGTLVEQGRTVEAIRLHRERTHGQLASSKSYVDSLAVRRSAAPAGPRPLLSMLVFLLVLAILILWMASP
jgi:ribosomal protein L7/L12